MSSQRNLDLAAVALASATPNVGTKALDCSAGLDARRTGPDRRLGRSFRVASNGRHGQRALTPAPAGRRTLPAERSAFPGLCRMLRMAIALLAIGLLGACASAPKVAHHGIATDRELTPVRDDRHARADRFLDADAVLAARSATLPRVDIADGAASENITPAQAALVANRAARDVCNALAPHLELVERDGDLDVELRLTSLQPTSREVAGVSEVIGYLVPVSVRLPAGLGGLAIDGVARDADGDVLVLRWAQGANAISDSALVSTIGDAYQLASEFADDFSEAVVDPRGKEGDTRVKLDRRQREANKALCRARFGSQSVAGLGASFMLPLPPEMIDDGAPDSPGAVTDEDGRNDERHD